ncbi:MAG: hypothetical protein ACLR23_28490 [Clostridia bacterium]
MAEIDNGIVAEVLPNAGDNIDGAEPGRLAEEIDGGAAERLDDDIDNAVVGIEKALDHADENDDGDKVREIADGLDDLSGCRARLRRGQRY